MPFGADIHRGGGHGRGPIDPEQRLRWRAFPPQGAGVYSLPPMAIRPVPTSPVPVYIGAGAAAGVRRAARLADGFFSNAPFDTFPRTSDGGSGGIGEGGDASRRVSSGPGTPACNVSDDPQRGLEELAPHLHAMTWKYRDMGESASRPGGPAGPPPYDPAQAERLGRRALIGTGEQIVEQLGELEIVAGVPIDFVARSYFPP